LSKKRQSGVIARVIGAFMEACNTITS
jgi:hypothetical protein